MNKRSETDDTSGDPPAQPSVHRAPVPSYSLEQVSFLILERHTLIRRVMRSILGEFRPARVDEFSTPIDAFKSFQTDPVDIILSDWTPDLDGISFLRRVRRSKDSPNPYVPVVIVTARTEHRHVCVARDNGMTEFLAKPVSAGQLYRRICWVIENHRPFIKANDFFGPDRRRRTDQLYKGPERRVLHLT